MVTGIFIFRPEVWLPKRETENLVLAVALVVWYNM